MGEDKREIWVYELNFPKNMNITYEDAYKNLYIKRIALDDNIHVEDMDNDALYDFIKGYTHDITEDDFDGCIPTIYSSCRDDVGAMRNYLDAIVSKYNTCRYYDFTNTSKYQQYSEVFNNLYRAALYNCGYIPDKEVIEY